MDLIYYYCSLLALKNRGVDITALTTDEIVQIAQEYEDLLVQNLYDIMS